MSLVLAAGLPSRGYTPRWHGNGFVQLQLDEHKRLHVWSPETQPRAENNATIHNHVWGMHSTVLLGTLNHTTYSVSMDGEGKFDQHIVKNGEFLRLLRVQAIQTGCYDMVAGSEYFFQAFQYHTSAAKRAMTLIVKFPLRYPVSGPGVLCPHGQQPYDAHGDDRLTSDEMWKIIDDAMMACQPAALVQLERLFA